MDQPAAMYVARIKSGYTGKDRQHREYESQLPRDNYRDGGKVRHKTPLQHVEDAL